MNQTDNELKRRGRKIESNQSFQNSLDLPAFQKNWSTFQELLLLEAIQMFGDNWQIVSNFVGQTPLQARNHYLKYYRDHQSKLIPDDSEWVITQNVNPVFVAKTKENIEKKQIPSETFKQGMKTLRVKLPTAFGIYEKTKQFMNGYNPTLEYFIRDLRILPEDSEREKKEKLRIIEIYKQKIKERREVEMKSITNGLFETKFEIDQIEKKSEVKKKVYKKKTMRQKYELEEQQPAEVKSLWVTYSKLLKHDKNQKLKGLLEKYIHKDKEVKEERINVEKKLESIIT